MNSGNNKRCYRILLYNKLEINKPIKLNNQKLKRMKHIFTLLLAVISFFANGQNLISPITINLPANPPANTAEWATALPPVMILAQTKLVNGQINGMVQESKILVTIKSGGSKVCGTYTPQTAPISGFNSANKNWTGTNVLSLLGQECTLKPGSYELCVQFYSFDGRIIGENCKPFTIADKKQEAESYSPPQNISPANEKRFKPEEVKGALTFRWTPVVPKPKEQVTYRLKVWQLMQGQSSTQAMRTNQPIVTKDVDNITQAIVTNIYTGPCRPPYLCDFVWSVEAVAREAAQGTPKSFGSSTPTAFSVGSPECHLEFTKNLKDSTTVICKGQTANGGNIYNVCTWLYNKNNSTSNALTVTNLTSIIAGNIISAVTPVFSFVIPAGGAQKVCFDISVPAAQTHIKVKAFSNYAGADGSDCTSNPLSDSIPLTPCRCNLCDSNVVKWEIQSEIKYDSTSTNNILTLRNDVSFSPYKVVKLSTEIVDFYWYTEGDCKKCNTNDYYFGNIVSGTISGTSFTNAGTSVAGPGGTPIPSSHQLDFIANSLAGATLNNDTYLNISLPPQTQLSCCTDCFRFCIRYTVTFMDNGVCKTCSIVKCYESKRKHRKTELQQAINACGEPNIIQTTDNTHLIK